IVWQPNLPRKGFIPIENRSLSELYKLGFKEKSSSYAKTELRTQFFYKSIMPFLSLIVVFAVSPFCVFYARKIPIFFIYAMALFGYITFFTLMDASVILGENHIVSPFLAVFAPFALCSAASFWKFYRT